MGSQHGWIVGDDRAISVPMQGQIDALLETGEIPAAAKLKGRKLPMLDRVEIAIIEEAQPRWLAFLLFLGLFGAIVLGERLAALESGRLG